jgi:hypothetical protein
MGIKQLCACLCSKTYSDNRLGFTASIILPFDMVSTPPPMPIPISPAAIAFATVATAYSPELHKRFMP